MISIPMTPKQFAAKAAELKADAGIDLSGKSGAVSKKGVSAMWTYDGATLSITITRKPLLYPIALCEQQISEWLTAPAIA